MRLMGLAERLHQKGWSQAEIDHAVSHMALAQQQKSKSRRVFEEFLYWLAMLLLAGGVILVVYYLVPFLNRAAQELGWPSSVGYTVVALLGIVVGILFAHLLHDIADLQQRHHAMVLFLAALTVAITALLVGQYSVPLAATFATVFILYYSVVWWKRGR